MSAPADFSSLPQLRPRSADSHKGDYGRALLIGGSTGMSGAISLAGMAALRGGAGLVRLAVPRACQDVVAGHEPSYMTVGLPCDAEGRVALAARDRIVGLAKEATVIAVGPGLGRSPELDELVGWIYQVIPKPIVFDADALNALADQPAVLETPGGPRILTPHPGEFSRLANQASLAGQSRRAEAYEFTARLDKTILVLKGRHTLITDGQRTATGTTGNPGMATGGSGDVLTGLIAALVCQDMTGFDAAHLAVHLHGLAGDIAAAKLGQQSLIASDLVRYLPQAFGRHLQGR